MDMDVDFELETEISRRELRSLLLHEFRLGRKATSNICGTIGMNVLSVRTAQHWFRRFKNENFEFDDVLLHTERSLQVAIDLLKQLTEEDPRLTIQSVFSSATWMLSHCSASTSPRIR